jgi:hypothetical protein
MSDIDTSCPAGSHTDRVIRSVYWPSRVKDKVNIAAVAAHATLLTCGYVTPGTDKTTTIAQHDNETESTGNGASVSLHVHELNYFPTYLARAVSEATLICVQAVTTA